jgi:hypothetical protein
VVDFTDPDLRMADHVWLASREVATGSMFGPQSVNLPVPNQLFVMDRSPSTRTFAADGRVLAASATTDLWAAGRTQRMALRLADGDGTSGEVVGAFVRWQKVQGRQEGEAELWRWEVRERGIGRYRTTQQRSHGELVDVLEPVWEHPIVIPNPDHTDEIVALAYNRVEGTVDALIHETNPRVKRDTAWIERFPIDGTPRTRKVNLPDYNVSQASFNPYVDLNVGPDGSLFVLDDANDRVLVFDSTSARAGQRSTS